MSWAASHKTVCVPCRLVWKTGRTGWALSTRGRVSVGPATVCSQCGAPTQKVSYKWRPPKKSNDKAWKRVAAGDWLWEVNQTDKRSSDAAYERRGVYTGRIYRPDVEVIEAIKRTWIERGKRIK